MKKLAAEIFDLNLWEKEGNFDSREELEIFLQNILDSEPVNKGAMTEVSYRTVLNSNGTASIKQVVTVYDGSSPELFIPGDHLVDTGWRFPVDKSTVLPESVSPADFSAAGGKLDGRFAPAVHKASFDA